MKFSLGEMLKAFIGCRCKSFALTVGELAVSTAVVGTVAVLTLGGVNNALQTKAMNTQETLLNNDIGIALANMQSKGKLAGYKTQEDFMKEFQNYYDVKEVLTTDEQVKEHFADKYTIAGKEVSPDDFKLKFVTGKGESVALTYNTNYKPSGQFVYDSSTINSINGVTLQAQNSAMAAVSGFYDVNGAKSPNKEGKDAGLLATMKSNCNNTNLISMSNGKCVNDFDPPVEVCDCAKNPEMEKCKEPIVVDYCTEHPSDRNCICMKEPTNPLCTNTDTSCADIDCAKPENEFHPCCYDPPVEECCPLTDDNCKAQNRTLNKKKCECECTKPKKQGNLELDPVTCTYICKKDMSGFNPNYTDFEKSKKECACVTKDIDARERCKANGGRWDDDICSCVCPESVIKQCKENSCGYAETNLNANYCACECKKPLFDSNLEGKAKSEDKLSGKKLQTALETTVYDSNIANKCFTCKSSDSTDITIKKGNCACIGGCKNKPADTTKYPYFKFNDYGDEQTSGPVCSWSCDTKKLKALVDELNKAKADDDLRPFAMDKYKKSTETYGAGITNESFQNTDKLFDFTKFKEASSENMKQAQNWYFLAAVIGKMINDGVQEDNPPGFIRIQGCESRSCKDVYKTAYLKLTKEEAFNTSGRFYKFLVYFNDVEKDDKYGHAAGIQPYVYQYLLPRSSYGTEAKLKELFKMKYVADTNKCAVQLQEFNYGAQPVDNMWFHGANKGDTYNLACHTFSYEYAENKNNFKVKNPNTETVAGVPADYPTPIVRPEGFKAYNGEYGDANYWNKRRVGVVILHQVSYDPLALNMSTDATKAKANPTFNDKGTMKLINLDYSNGKYNPVKVYWPNSDYQFLVLKDYASNNNVSYMFSDVYVQRLGTIFKTGFDQLKAEMDSTKDGLVNANDSKFASLYLISDPKASSSTLIPINDKVFEINTNYGVQTDKAGRAMQTGAAVFENYSTFRRLLPISGDINTYCSGKTCLVFDKWISSANQASIELWYDLSNADAQYALKPTDGKVKSSYSYKWYIYSNGSYTATTPTNLVMLHKIGNKYYYEIQAKVTDIIFKSKN